MESPSLAVKTTSDPFEGQKHDSLLQAARALVDERRLAEMKQQADRAKAEQNYRKQQRLFQFVRVTVAEEVKVTFAPRSEAGVETTCCGQCSGLLADRSTQLAAVICHPWGPLGGSMTDVTVSEITREFETAGISTLRINFRTGIGRGHSAAEDVRGACALLSSLDVPPRRILLVGYSYGSMVVADVADSIAAVAAFAIVAPPLGAAGPLFFGRDVMRSAQQSTKPKLALIGNADQFCTERRFTVFARQMSAPAQSYVVSDETSSAFPQQQCCSQDGCSHGAGRVDHMNIYRQLERFLPPWVSAVFGVPFAELSTSSGDVVATDESARGGVDTHTTPQSPLLGK